MHLPLFWATLCCLLILPGTARANEILVAVDHFPPWKIVDEYQYSGIDIQLTEALLGEIGIEPLFEAFPWSRSLEMLRTGHVSLMSGVLRTPEREKDFHFVEPPYKTQSSKVFYRREGSTDIKSYEDLRNLDIGVQRGVRYFPRFDADRRLSKKPVPDDSFNFKKLNQGRLDAVISTESQGDYLIATLGMQGKIVKSTYRHDMVTPVYFAVSRCSPLAERLDALNAAARRLHDNGTFDQIIKNYFRKLMQKQ